MCGLRAEIALVDPHLTTEQRVRIVEPDPQGVVLLFEPNLDRHASGHRITWRNDASPLFVTRRCDSKARSGRTA
jgi:hypothetical protein